MTMNNLPYLKWVFRDTKPRLTQLETEIKEAIQDRDWSRREKAEKEWVTLTHGSEADYVRWCQEQGITSNI